jgi:hypothetical protein
VKTEFNGANLLAFLFDTKFKTCVSVISPSPQNYQEVESTEFLRIATVPESNTTCEIPARNFKTVKLRVTGVVTH